MTDARTIGWTAARSQSRHRIFQRILGFNMALQIAVGLACMFAPDRVAHIRSATTDPPPDGSGVGVDFLKLISKAT